MLVELQASFRASATSSSASLPRQAHQGIPALSVVLIESLLMTPYCSHLRQRYCLQSLIFVRYGYLSRSLLVISLAVRFLHGCPCYVGRLPFELVTVRYQYWLHACFCCLSAFWWIGGENFRPSFSDLPLVALIARI